MGKLLTLLVRLHLSLVLSARARDRDGRDGRDGRDERGDVPGWVLVTIMTVGLMAVISSLASDQLSAMLRSALNSVR